MTVKVIMPAPKNLVAPLPHKGTAMHIAETADRVRAWSGAVSPMIGASPRRGNVDSAASRSTRPTLASFRTSTTATRTTTTSRPLARPGLSADSNLFELLVAAYLDCRRAKRNTASALAFEAHLERNLFALYRELIDGSYTPGRSICFVNLRPKPREVWAADFRDRIVHHLLYNYIAPRFHASFIADSCACIPGRGTLYAAKRLEHKVRSITRNWKRRAFYLKMDIANFFVSIDKPALWELLAPRIPEPWWRALAETILFHDPREDVELRGNPDTLELVPPHKRLANQVASKGLPIGNLSSQFFANVYMDALDKFVKHQLSAQHYTRYVDDFILLHESPRWLNAAREVIEQFLPNVLGIHVNPTKTILQPIDRGIDYVGHVIKPWRRVTRPRTVRTALRRIAEMPDEDVFASGNSYLGLARQASHSHADQARIANALLARGHCVNGALTKIYRKRKETR